MGDGRLGYRAAGQQAQNIQNGEGQHIHQRNPLEIRGVRKRGGQVDEQPAEEASGKQFRAYESEEQKNRGDRNSPEGRQIARSKGAQALLRVTAVSIDVQQIVDDISRRSGKREAAECLERSEQFGDAESMGEKQRHKDEQILGPLVEANGLE